MSGATFFNFVVCFSVSALSGASLLQSCVTSQPRSEGSSGACSSGPEVIPPMEKDLSKLKPEILLAAYLKVNTTNPPGCEGKAARFWKKFFDFYGVDSEIIPLPFGDDRANIMARVKGNSKGGRPLLLLNHMDVVPVERSRWTVDPFAGVIRDGFIFGRGTFDMKATGAYQALMLVKASVQKWSMDRDLIFLGTSNEEGPFDPELGVISGAEWMLKYRLKDLGDPEFVVTEGGYIPSPEGKPLRWEVSPGEKARIEVTFRVENGITDQSLRLKKMARAARLVMQSFDKIILQDPIPGANQKILQDPVLRANYMTTHALTILGGVGKGNTIPAEADAEVILRDIGAYKSAKTEIMKVIGDNAALLSMDKIQDDLVIRLKSNGEAGHASVPPINGGANRLLLNAIIKLDEAVIKQQIPAAEMRIKSLASISDESGPRSTDFVVDFRLLPGKSRDQIIDQIKSLIVGMNVTIQITDDAVIANASPTNTPLFASIVKANRYYNSLRKTNVPVETPILTSTTDAAYFRQRGMIVYGFEPIMLNPKDEHSHGDDERIPATSMQFATDVTEFYLKDFLGVTRSQ